MVKAETLHAAPAGKPTKGIAQAVSVVFEGSPTQTWIMSQPGLSNMSSLHPIHISMLQTIAALCSSAAACEEAC